MQQVTMDEAQARLRDLMEAASRGEQVVISDGEVLYTLEVHANGTANASVEEFKPRPGFGGGRGLFKMAPDFDEPLEDFKEYME